MDLKESCGSQGSHESFSLRPTSWQAFASTSTLHGLRFIFPYGQTGARRLLWAAALLACLGLLALESAERLAYFLSYPHLTSVDAIVSSSLVFPAVTICNLNTYRFSRLTSNDLYHAGELLALLDVDLAIPQPHLAEPDVLTFLQERTNFTAYKAKAFSMKEFMDRVVKFTFFTQCIRRSYNILWPQKQRLKREDLKNIYSIMYLTVQSKWVSIVKGN
uniref:Uncharacterized protein n=1 Tax=Cyprinodon variegatus TaxID=28743 RepID=A0A3Q2D6B7_CYPVA